jgi:hypothetical protein
MLIYQILKMVEYELPMPIKRHVNYTFESFFEEFVNKQTYKFQQNDTSAQIYTETESHEY